MWWPPIPSPTTRQCSWSAAGLTRGSDRPPAGSFLAPAFLVLAALLATGAGRTARPPALALGERRPVSPTRTSRKERSKRSDVGRTNSGRGLGAPERRLVYIDPAGQAHAQTWDNWRWRLSARGIQAATGGSWEPRDPEGYLRRLRRRVPDLDEAAETYVREALSAFNARCFLACSVMLGVASEQVFGRLTAAFVATAGDDATPLRKLLENPNATYYRRFVEFRKRIEPLGADASFGPIADA